MKPVAGVHSKFKTNKQKAGTRRDTHFEGTGNDYELYLVSMLFEVEENFLRSVWLDVRLSFFHKI